MCQSHKECKDFKTYFLFKIDWISPAAADHRKYQVGMGRQQSPAADPKAPQTGSQDTAAPGQPVLCRALEVQAARAEP